jgi:methyltransferase (TIGR00027 family)
MTGEIEHVTDTAFWVASFRALETERPNAAFRDPLAGVLAGEKGRQIAQSMSGARLMSFIMVLRTTAIDRLVLSAIERGVDTVLNLGAGLDTRPYRMELPASMRWFEADFPSMISYKNDKLAGEQAKCQLERIAVDLTDRAARKALLARVGQAGRRVLVITEGVINYLHDDEAARLAEDVHAEPAMQYWIQDYYSAEARRHRPPWRKKMKAAPFLFSAPDWFGFFEKYGFRVLEKIGARDEAIRIRRRPPFVIPFSLMLLVMPKKLRERAQNSLGYVLLERS